MKYVGRHTLFRLRIYWHTKRIVKKRKKTRGEGGEEGASIYDSVETSTSSAPPLFPPPQSNHFSTRANRSDVAAWLEGIRLLAFPIGEESYSGGTC